MSVRSILIKAWCSGGFRVVKSVEYSKTMFEYCEELIRELHRHRCTWCKEIIVCQTFIQDKRRPLKKCTIVRPINLQSCSSTSIQPEDIKEVLEAVEANCRRYIRRRLPLERVASPMNFIKVNKKN